MIVPIVSMIPVVFKWAVRLGVVIGVLLFLAVIFTSMLGGKGDIARGSLERIIFGMTGVHATVHILNDYRIFPDFKIDFKNMTGDLGQGPAPKIIAVQEQELPDVILEKFMFTQSSFRHLWGGAAILKAEFDHLIIRPGVFGPHALHLKTGRIVGPVQQDAHLPQPSAQFVMVGDYGGHDVTLSIPLVATAAGGTWYYRIDGTSDMVVQVDHISATGRLNIDDQNIIFDNIQTRIAGIALSGTITIPKSRVNSNDPLASFTLITGRSDAVYLVKLDRFDVDVSARVVSGDMGERPWPKVTREIQKILKQK